MGMSMEKTIKLLAVMALCMLNASCIQEDPIGKWEGKDIQFGAKAPVSTITKTVYSYHQETVESQLMERIDWDNGDLIRIICDQVSSTPKYFDYDITLSNNQNIKSFATADPHGADHGLQWGTGTHTFFSMYPSPETTGAQSGIGIALTGGSTATATGVIPADQSASLRTVTLDDSSTASYYGNMKLAYMTAAVEASAGTENVTLSFKPMVTTFFVSVVNTTGSTMTLKKVELTSSSSALTGRYQIAMDKNNNRPGDYKYWDGDNWVDALTYANRNNIYASFPSGVSIPATGDNSITVALFALPHEISNLTLTVTTDETGPISLPLKYNDTFITFAGEKKHNISNINVPNVSYALDVDPVLIEYDYLGAYSPDDQEFTVSSYKTIGATSTDTPWQTQIWIDADDDGVQDDDEWEPLADVVGTSDYSWLTNFPLTSAALADDDDDSSDLTLTYHKSITGQEVTSHEDRLKNGILYDTDGTTTILPSAHNTAATAIDLSMYDFVDRKKESSRYTANTYVVSSPGYYKIPIVFGNCIENGQNVSDTYEGRSGAGHLNHFICVSALGTEVAIWMASPPWLNEGQSRGARIHWEKYSYWDNSASEMKTSYGTWSSPNSVEVINDVHVESSGTERYLVFNVREDNIRPGNVMLAVTTNADGTGDVCWSWQIWITDQDMTPVTINNGSQDYNILPVNLGWTDMSKGLHYEPREALLRFASTEKSGLVSTHTLTVRQLQADIESLTGWSTFYQWGRKDPMTDGPTQVYDNDGYVHESIKHPGNIMYDKGSFFGDRYYDWTLNNYNNLWDSKNTDYKNPSGNLPNHKTVYDPSPRKFSVPPDEAWDGFAGTGGIVSYNPNGIWFKTGIGDGTVFFPASGFMNYITAESSIGESIDNGYWTYHPYENVQRRASYCMRFTYSSSGGYTLKMRNSSDIGEQDRAYGYSVRPVAYYVIGMNSALLQFSNAGWSNNQDLNNASYTNNGVTVTFGKWSSIGNNPTYNSTSESVILDIYSSITVTAPGAIEEIIIEYGDGDGGDGAGSPNISVNSPSGGTYSNGCWYATYDTSTNTLSPSTTEVVFRTAGTGLTNDRVIKSIRVSYKH